MKIRHHKFKRYRFEEFFLRRLVRETYKRYLLTFDDRECFDQFSCFLASRIDLELQKKFTLSRYVVTNLMDKVLISLSYRYEKKACPDESFDRWFERTYMKLKERRLSNESLEEYEA